ncbi:MAG TPA: hypothetical protein VF007_08170 [Stellaceae bacterium]
MKATLILDEDVAAGLRRLQRSRRAKLDTLINEALRRGIAELTGLPSRRKQFQTKVVNLGPLLIPIDNIAEAITLAEGEWHR